MPPGEAQPLHVVMSELLNLSGVQVSRDPVAVFEWLSRETPAYANLDYDGIGLTGCPTAPAPEVVLR